MPSFMRQLLAFVILASILSGVMGCATKKTYAPLNDYPMTAWGRGEVPEGGGYTVTQRRLMAIRAAELDAVVALAVLSMPPGTGSVEPAEDLLSFFRTWVQYAEPEIEDGTAFVRATSPAPSHEAYANYMAWHVNDRLQETRCPVRGLGR